MSEKAMETRAWAEIAPETREVERRWGSVPEGMGSRRSRSPYTYKAYVPKPIAERDFQVNGETTAAIAAAQQACTELNINPPDALHLEALARQLLRAEAVASSRIEGLVLSHRRLARAFFIDPEGNDTAAAVVANVRATERAIELASSAEAITVGTIIEIHHTLFAGTRDEGIGGLIREEQNWVGGSSSGPADAEFVPPPAEFVRPALEDLADFFGRTDLAPVLQAAVAHAQFETIHPFTDGNGRTGRALVQVILRRRAIAPDYVPPISVVLAADKRRYVEGLIAFRETRENEWLETFAVAAARAADLAATYLKEVQQLQAEWRERLRGIVKREDAAAWLLIDQLPGSPIISTAIGVAHTGRSKPRVQQAVDHLVEAKVLLPLSGGKRNRQWEAAGLLDLLADLEAAQPHRPDAPVADAATRP